MERFFAPDLDDDIWKMALPSALPAVAVLNCHG
jgi:hypothetical protein